MYMRAQVNSYAIANICWLVSTFCISVSGYKCILQRFGCMILRPKANFDKIFTLHNRLRKKLIHIFSIIALHVNWAYIEYSLSQIGKGSMQCLRCYDHSNKCSFLVIQSCEVLLNLFGEWMFRNMDCHVGGTWVIHVTKGGEDDQLRNLKHVADYRNLIM